MNKGEKQVLELTELLQLLEQNDIHIKIAENKTLVLSLETTPNLVDNFNISKVRNLLHSFGISEKLRGEYYLQDAIKIAKKHHTTCSGIEHSIRYAIEVAWKIGDQKVIENLFGFTVSPSKGRPTNSEFIAIIADYLKIHS